MGILDSMLKKAIANSFSVADKAQALANQQGAVSGNGLLDLLFCGFVHGQNPPYPKKQAADESF